MMKISALLVTISIVLITSILLWFYASDAVVCIVKDSEIDMTNGYYIATNGYYHKLYYHGLTFPDVFSYFNFRLQEKQILSESSILFTQGNWIISVNNPHPKGILINNESNQIHHPPSSNWKSIGATPVTSQLTIDHIYGNLENSPSSTYTTGYSNIDQLWGRPITCLLLIIIFYIAYILWAHRIDVARVSFSYDSIVNNGQYWRIFTSSFAHFDLLHLGFNTMSLYQLGSLEYVYGSLAYGYLSLTLVILTMLICLLIHGILIFKYNKTEYLYQQGVGYSCVLFAWMVTISVRQSQFCPIFLFPSFCLNTWFIPMPAFLGLGQGLPINLGPFFLLLFTKMLIPRSSFIGHLAGILIGYPLAWNALNWLTPPVSLSILAIVWIVQTKSFVWKFQSFESSVQSLQDYVSPISLSNYSKFWYATFVLISLSLFLPIVFGFEQLFVRLTLIFIVWSGLQARKIEYFISNVFIQKECGYIMIWSGLFALCVMLIDFANWIVLIQNQSLFLGSDFAVSYLWFGIIATTSILIAEIVYLYQWLIVINEMPECSEFLLSWRLDLPSLFQDLQTYNPIRSNNQQPIITPFSGRSFRLSGTTPLSSTTNSMNNGGRMQYELVPSRDLDDSEHF